MTTKSMKVASPSKVLFYLSVIVLEGCAVHYKDSEGAEYHIGLISMKVEKQEGLLISTKKSVGLTIDATKESGGVNFGVRSVTKSYIQNNSDITIEGAANGKTSIKEHSNSSNE